MSYKVVNWKDGEQLEMKPTPSSESDIVLLSCTGCID